MNDRQRTILGLVAVFSLAGVALLSLAFTKETGSVQTQGFGREAIVSQTDIPVVVPDQTVSIMFSNNKLTVKARQDVYAPAAAVAFVYDGKLGTLSVDGKPVKSGGVVNIGQLAAGSERVLQVSNIKGTVDVSASDNGFDYLVSDTFTLQ